MHNLQDSSHALNSWVWTQARQLLAAVADPLGTGRKQVDELPLRFQGFEIRLDLCASSSSFRCRLNPSTGELSNVTLIAHHQLQLAPLMPRRAELLLSVAQTLSHTHTLNRYTCTSIGCSAVIELPPGYRRLWLLRLLLLLLRWLRLFGIFELVRQGRRPARLVACITITQGQWRRRAWKRPTVRSHLQHQRCSRCWICPNLHAHLLLRS